MTSLPAKLLLFIAANAAGAFSVGADGLAAVLNKLYPQPQDAALLRHVNNWVFGGGMWVWIVMAVISVGVFLGDGRGRLRLLLLPLLVPALYTAGAIFWFSDRAAAP
jgi:hypothetical protein